jgi:hypothetical protein
LTTGWPADAYPVLVEARATTLIRNQYFLWTRLSVRVVEDMSLVALGRNPHGVAVAAALVFGLYDLGLAVLLHCSGCVPSWLRLGLDSLDVAAWSVAIGSAPDVAALAAARWRARPAFARACAA